MDMPWIWLHACLWSIRPKKIFYFYFLKFGHNKTCLRHGCDMVLTWLTKQLNKRKKHRICLPSRHMAYSRSSIGGLKGCKQVSLWFSLSNNCFHSWCSLSSPQRFASHYRMTSYQSCSDQLRLSPISTGRHSILNSHCSVGSVVHSCLSRRPLFFFLCSVLQAGRL